MAFSFINASTTIDFSGSNGNIASNKYSAQGISNFVNGYINNNALEYNGFSSSGTITITFTTAQSVVRLQLTILANNISNTTLTAYDGADASGNTVGTQTLGAVGQFEVSGTNNIKSIQITHVFNNVGSALWNDYDDLYFDTTPLPVELVSFNANLIEDKVELNWNTATEVNNYGFEIQRQVLSIESGVGSNGEWEKIGFVKGNGNSNSPKDYSFTDNPLGGTTFKYRLKQIDFDGQYKYSDEVEVELEISKSFSVAQNYPNPFNPSTTIKFSLPEESRVSAVIYNILGEEVKQLVASELSPGKYEFNWNASNNASGMYLLKVTAVSADGQNKYSKITKMILVK